MALVFGVAVGDALAVAGGILGALGVPTLIAWQARVRRWSSLQRFRRLRYKEPIDFVLPTHGVARVDSSVLIGFDRVATTLGNLKAATRFSEVIGEASSDKGIVTHLSGGEEGPLDGDLLLLGGSHGNSRVSF